MKKLLYWLSIPLLLVIILLLGPKPDKPDLNGDLPKITRSGEALADSIDTAEQSVVNLKENNEARIVWADTANKTKTPYSIVYLHGFSASQMEGYPVHRNLAREFGCNMYLARWAQHGIEDDSLFKDLTTEAMVNTAKRAVAVGKQIGDSVIIVATSTGGTLGLYIASRNPEIKAIVCYSPLIKLYDPNSFVITMPWGRNLMKLIIGGDFREVGGSEEIDKYWNHRYMIDGLVALQSLVENTMTEETFEMIRCPLFLGYYYKNDSLQDHTVSVPAMLEMFDQVSTPAEDKVKVAFPEAGDHVIASALTTDHWELVQAATIEFLEKYVPKPVKSDSSAVMIEAAFDEEHVF